MTSKKREVFSMKKLRPRGQIMLKSPTRPGHYKFGQRKMGLKVEVGEDYGFKGKKGN